MDAKGRGPGTTRRARLGARALLGALVAAGVALLAGSDLLAGPTVQPGDEVFAVDPGIVLEVSILTPDFRLIAHRWEATEPFAILFQSRSPRRHETCEAGKGFDSVLKKLCSIRAEKAFPPGSGKAAEGEVEDGGKPWGTLTVRDASLIEPFSVDLWKRAGADRDVVLRLEGAHVAVSADSLGLDAAARGCRGLGSQPEGK